MNEATPKPTINWQSKRVNGWWWKYELEANKPLVFDTLGTPPKKLIRLLHQQWKDLNRARIAKYTALEIAPARPPRIRCEYHARVLLKDYFFAQLQKELSKNENLSN